MYDATISHDRRTAFIIAIDCSASMQERIIFNRHMMTKADAVALVCNYLIDELVARATRSDNVRNYYDIGVVEYSGRGVCDILPAAIDGLTPVDILAQYAPPQKKYCFEQYCESGYTPTAIFSISEWITPTAYGKTPMHEAMCHIYEIMYRWCTRPENSESFPPMVFNITDGELSDGHVEDMRIISERIMSLSTSNGNILVFNIHLSGNDDNEHLIFPSDWDFYSSNAYKQMLFNMSSILPANMEPLITQISTQKGRGPFRGVAFNASICELLAVLTIGSQSTIRIR